MVRGTLSRTIAASFPEGRRSVAERLRAWRETKAGRLAWYVVEVGVVTGLYYGAARAGLHLAYLHGSVTALWPPVGVGIAALVIGGPGLWPGIVVRRPAASPTSRRRGGRSSVRRSGTRSRSSSRRCCSCAWPQRRSDARARLGRPGPRRLRGRRHADQRRRSGSSRSGSAT